MIKKIVMIIGLLYMLWFTLSTLEVQIHNANHNHEYSKINMWYVLTTTTKEMKVVDVSVADKETDTMEITVEDIKGNRYAYYDSTTREIGTILYVSMHGNEVSNVKGQN